MEATPPPPSQQSVRSKLDGLAEMLQGLSEAEMEHAAQLLRHLKRERSVCVNDASSSDAANNDGGERVVGELSGVDVHGRSSEAVLSSPSTLALSPRRQSSCDGAVHTSRATAERGSESQSHPNEHETAVLHAVQNTADDEDDVPIAMLYARGNDPSTTTTAAMVGPGVEEAKVTAATPRRTHAHEHGTTTTTTTTTTTAAVATTPSLAHFGFRSSAVPRSVAGGSPTNVTDASHKQRLFSVFVPDRRLVPRALRLWERNDEDKCAATTIAAAAVVTADHDKGDVADAACAAAAAAGGATTSSAATMHSRAVVDAALVNDVDEVEDSSSLLHPPLCVARDDTDAVAALAAVSTHPPPPPRFTSFDALIAASNAATAAAVAAVTPVTAASHAIAHAMPSHVLCHRCPCAYHTSASDTSAASSSSSPLHASPSPCWPSSSEGARVVAAPTTTTTAAAVAAAAAAATAAATAAVPTAAVCSDGFDTEVVFCGFYAIAYDPFQSRPPYFGTYNHRHESNLDARELLAMARLPRLGGDKDNRGGGGGGCSGAAMPRQSTVDYDYDSGDDWDTLDGDDCIAASSDDGGGGSSSDEDEDGDGGDADGGGRRRKRQRDDGANDGDDDDDGSDGDFINDDDDDGDDSDCEIQRRVAEARERRWRRLRGKDRLLPAFSGPFVGLSRDAHPLRAYDRLDRLQRLDASCYAAMLASELSHLGLLPSTQSPRCTTVSAGGRAASDGNHANSNDNDENDDDNKAAVSSLLLQQQEHAAVSAGKDVCAATREPGGGSDTTLTMWMHNTPSAAAASDKCRDIVDDVSTYVCGVRAEGEAGRGDNGHGHHRSRTRTSSRRRSGCGGKTSRSNDNDVTVTASHDDTTDKAQDEAKGDVAQQQQQQQVMLTAATQRGRRDMREDECAVLHRIVAANRRASTQLIIDVLRQQRLCDGVARAEVARVVKRYYERQHGMLIRRAQPWSPTDARLFVRPSRRPPPSPSQQQQQQQQQQEQQLTSSTGAVTASPAVTTPSPMSSSDSGGDEGVTSPLQQRGTGTDADGEDDNEAADGGDETAVAATTTALHSSSDTHASTSLSCA